MKSLVKVLAVICALFCAGSAFAKNKTVKVPDNDEVIIVMRVNVTTDQDINWHAQARNIPETELTHGDSYCLPFMPVKSMWAVSAKDIMKFEETSWAKGGDYVFAKYGLNKDRTLYFFSPITYFFKSHYQLALWLPTKFCVTIPKGDKFVYLGDFSYKSEGFNFALKDLNVSDNYEDAQNALNAVTKKPQQLVRGNVQAIPDEIKASDYAYSYEAVSVNFRRWFNRFDD